MEDLLKVKIPYSTVHLFFPRIVIFILCFLAVVLLIQYALKCKREHKPFINKEKLKFFEPGYDKVKLFGSLVLFILYIITLEPWGFLLSSIIFIFLFNLLFAGSVQITKSENDKQSSAWIMRLGTVEINWKSVLVGLAISVITSTVVWFLFYKIFNITLP